MGIQAEKDEGALHPEQLSDDILDEMGFAPSTPIVLSVDVNISDIKKFREIKHQHNDIPIPLIEEYYDKIGPSALLDVVEEDKFCHNKGHNIGRVIYAKTDDLGQSVRICRSRCTTACFHGVLMGLFAPKVPGLQHVSLDNVKGELNTICDSQDIVQERSIGKGSCYHGLGHASMFLAGYNIEKGIELCKSLSDQIAQYLCATGGYMERSMVHKDTERSLLFPCDQHKNFPAACYRYKLRRIFKGKHYSDVAAVCLALGDPDQRKGCFHGYGFMFWKRVYRDPKLLPKLCSYGNHMEQRICIEGVAGKLRNYSKKIRKNACATLHNNELKNACQEATNEGTSKDPELYYYVHK